MKSLHIPRYLLIAFIAIELIGLSSCITPSSLYKQGQNEAAIQLAVDRLRKKKRDKDIIALENAYNRVVKPSLDRIEFLKMEGQPENWPKIYSEYAKIKEIQNDVKPLLPLFIDKEFRNADIRIINIDEEVLDAKRKAAEFTYASAMKLMEIPGKAAKRQAYQKFLNVKSYYSDYKDTDEQLKRAHEQGMNFVSLAFEDNSQMLIPKEFVKEMMSVQTASLQSLWVTYHNTAVEGTTYDYQVVMNLRELQISPERLSDREWTEEKVVEDGWKYVLDAKGNVKKDSLGNDIKEKKYKTIRCTLRQTTQSKAGYLAGNFEYRDAQNQGQLLKAVPFRQELIFNHSYTKIVKGNIEALKPESKALIGGQPMPFPSNEKMVMDAASLVKGAFADCLRSHVDLVLQ